MKRHECVGCLGNCKECPFEQRNKRNNSKTRPQLPTVKNKITLKQKSVK